MTKKGNKVSMSTAWKICKVKASKGEISKKNTKKCVFEIFLGKKKKTST